MQTLPALSPAEKQFRQFKAQQPDYEVSNLGRCRRVASGRRTHIGRIMQGYVNSDGYTRLGLRFEGRRQFIFLHEAIALAFIGPKPDGQQVNHIDANKSNNTPRNLKYVTHLENMRHAFALGLRRHPQGTSNGRAKLDVESVQSIRRLHAKGLAINAIAKQFGINKATASFVVNRKTWKHVV